MGEVASNHEPPATGRPSFYGLWPETYRGRDLPAGPLKGTLDKLMSMHDKTYVHLTSHDHQQSWKTEVIAETPRWICLNKPSHLATEYDHYHQDRPHMSAIVENDLRRQAGWIKERNIRWLKPVNILDFELHATQPLSTAAHLIVLRLRSVRGVPHRCNVGNVT